MPTPYPALVPDYIAQDKKVLAGNKLIIVDRLSTFTQDILSTTIRAAVINDKFEIIGTAFFAVHVLNNALIDSLANFIMNQEHKSGISLILNEEHVLTNNTDSDCAQLSKREFEILWLLARGLNPKKIAAFLCRSPRTTEDHINNIKIKYDCIYKAELIKKARYNGILNYLPISLAINKHTLSLF